MSLKSVITLLAVSALLGGCAATPKLQSSVPKVGAASQAYVLGHSDALKQTNHITAHLDENQQIIYSQNFGGGGAAAGLLLGPIGVAANVAAIGSNTKADAGKLRNKLGIDPKSLFLEAGGASGFSLGQEGLTGASAISPYIYVVKTEGEKLMAASALVVEQGEGKTKWIGRYMYQLPKTYTIPELSALDEAGKEELRASIRTGYVELLKFLTTETDAVALQEKKVQVKSDFLTPRIVIPLAGSLVSDSGELVWVRTTIGVFAVRKAHASYTALK